MSFGIGVKTKVIAHGRWLYAGTLTLLLMVFTADYRKWMHQKHPAVLGGEPLIVVSEPHCSHVHSHIHPQSTIFMRFRPWQF
jgi:hypothetical protein